jgi:hypothetical protein
MSGTVRFTNAAGGVQGSKTTAAAIHYPTLDIDINAASESKRGTAMSGRLPRTGRPPHPESVAGFMSETGQY